MNILKTPYYNERISILNNSNNPVALEAISGHSLMTMNIQPIRYCIDQILPQGIAMLSGSPKTGKSWLVLEWCIRIAAGEPIWNFNTTKGTTLYLCLEDNWSRVQSRISDITRDVPQNVFFAVASRSISDGLTEQIESFVTEHPDTVLVAIDTFQMIRKTAGDTSYSNDYQIISHLKELADRLQITILLVHHLRKHGSPDPLNMVSGTTGIMGALDTTLILEKEDRRTTDARLTCIGRDVLYREMNIRFSTATSTWNLISDSVENPEILLPDVIVNLIEFMKQRGSYEGSNTLFTEKLNCFCGKDVEPNHLKRLMNQYKNDLETHNIYFDSYRSSGKRYIKIQFRPQLTA